MLTIEFKTGWISECSYEFILFCSYDIKQKKAYSTVTAPVITFDFDYTVKGQIVSLPLEGNGHGWTKICKNLLIILKKYKYKMINEHMKYCSVSNWHECCWLFEIKAFFQKFQGIHKL